uniref:ShKT domain-containing protein n=1 Tax=Parascaris equorum TaxID=6256 RepID=A0A914RHM8_PAREQ
MSSVILYPLMPVAIHYIFLSSFYATYSGETTVSGIRSYTFETPYEVFDATLDENRGFRYENAERVNYFKEWDPCPNKTTFHNCSLLPFVDCSKRRNFCSECCDGNYVDGTYLLPPGMFPLKCYPGNSVFATVEV